MYSSDFLVPAALHSVQQQLPSLDKRFKQDRHSHLLSVNAAGAAEYSSVGIGVPALIIECTGEIKVNFM